MILISAIAMPALFLWRQEMVAFYLLVAVVYACYGTQLSVFPSATADFYGTRYLGLNYGLLFTAWGVAGIVGPILAARVYDTSGGDYRYAFFGASVLAVIAFVSLAFARAPKSAAAAAAP
jgi:OFA family oxalate/formate antiporter-like MFS transporter